VASCEWCGTWFEDKSVGGQPRVYCSDAHRQAAYRARKAAEAPVYSTQDDVDQLIADSRARFPGGRAGPYGGLDTPEDVEFERVAAEVKNADLGSRVGGGASAAVVQHWLRTGDIWNVAPGRKALVEDSSGQILLPKDLQVDVLNVARSAGLLRQLLDPRPTNRLKVPVGTLSAAATSWGALETGGTATDAAVVPAAGTPADIAVCDLVSLVKIGMDELEDTPAATNQMLTEVLGDAVAEAEDSAIASGSGSGQPAGLALAANVSRIPSGQKTTAAASNTPTLADVTGLPFKLPGRWLARAVWLMHPTAASKIAALTWTNGAPLWPEPGNPDPRTGGGLMGWRAYIVPGLPDPATAGTTDASVLFGDVRSAYRLIDRQRITLQRLTDRLVDLGQVGLLMRYRLGGEVVRPGALSAYLM
jgi:HK97 family phage major capsid protein